MHDNEQIPLTKITKAYDLSENCVIVMKEGCLFFCYPQCGQ